MDPSSSEQPAAVPPDTTEEEEVRITMATKSLRSHLGLPEDPTDKSPAAPQSEQPFFWVELSPPSPRGAKCQLHCGKGIMPGRYRIAVNPSCYRYGNDSSGMELERVLFLYNSNLLG